MNRTDRLLAIVLELQSRKIVRAEELAERFETSVRTIYRDMQALSEANVLGCGRSRARLLPDGGIFFASRQLDGR